MVDVLRNVAGKNSGKKPGGYLTYNLLVLFTGQDQTATQSDFNQARIQDSIIFGQWNPIGHLCPESLSGNCQVAYTSKNQISA